MKFKKKRIGRNVPVPYYGNMTQFQSCIVKKIFTLTIQHQEQCYELFSKKILLSCSPMYASSSLKSKTTFHVIQNESDGENDNDSGMSPKKSRTVMNMQRYVTRSTQYYKIVHHLMLMMCNEWLFITKVFGINVKYITFVDYFFCIYPSGTHDYKG